MLERASRPHGLRLLVTVTFNENQLRSHLLPLIALEEVESIALVSDVESPALPKVTAHVPTRRSQRLFGRAGAKHVLLRQLVSKSFYDWVIGFNFVPHGFNAQVVAARARTRSLYHMIGGALEWHGGGYAGGNAVLSRLPRPVPGLERALLRRIGRCDAIGVMGPHGGRQLVLAGAPAARIFELPPSVDTSRFQLTKRREPRWDVVTVGRLVPVKRQLDLLQALARLSRERGGIRAAIVGDGPLEHDLRREADRLGIGGQVDFLGRIVDVERIYPDARAFVLTSASEGLPIAMAEAMSMGTPVVASAVGEIPSIVDDDRNGLLFEAGDVGALAERLGRILSTPSEAERLGRAGAADTRARLSVASSAHRYQSLLSPPRSSTSSRRSSSTSPP